MAEISDETFGRACDLMQRYADLCGHTNAEVARALLASRTMARAGYKVEQDGHLTEAQGQVAVRLLEHWIRRTREQRQHQRQPDPRP